MARGKPVLSVIVSSRAATDLEEIYRYNAGERGIAAANRWEAFLKARIAGLATDYEDGKPIDGRPELHYLLMKKSGRWNDGHIAVYRVDTTARAVRVLHVFHTKEDWENEL